MKACEMKALIVDLDNTISFLSDNLDQKSGGVDKYRAAIPNIPVIEKLKFYKSLGYHITIFTSRNMRTYNQDIDKIKQNTLPIILEWLDANRVPYDAVQVGKPWCGFDGFYIDDRAIRPAEFVSNSYEQILEIMYRDMVVKS